MTYGILTNKVCRSVFEEINNLPYCKACRRARIEFAEKDKKHAGCYSNLLPGFSSEDVEIPIDVLIIGEAHGGGGEEWFREQRRKVYDEVDQLAQYYLAKELENFHQREMRCLFKALNKSGKKWVFTDLIKCFVSNDKVNDKYQKNRREAIKHCRRYLKKQIEVLQPKKILSLGKTVAKKYFNLELGKWKDEHGTIHNCKFPVIVSIFPSKNTADLWVENGGWEKVYKTF